MTTPTTLRRPPAASWLWGPYSRLGLGVALATLVLDQAHKWWMIEVYRIVAKGRVEVTPFLDLVFVKNTGISYSMFDQSSMAGQAALAAFAVARLGRTVGVAVAQRPHGDHGRIAGAHHRRRDRQCYRSG